VRLSPPIFYGQHRVEGDLFLKTNAAGADDAAFHIQHNQIAQRIFFGEVQLVFVIKAAVARPVAEGEVLQGTFAAFVAHRAIEGVVGEQKFQNTLSVIQRRLGIHLHYHSFGNRGGAGGHRLGEKANYRIAIFIQLHLSGGPIDGRDANLYQAHAAHAHRVQFGVVTKNRNFVIDFFGGFHNQRPFGYADLYAVNG